MIKSKIKYNEETKEYYLDLTDFAPFVDITKVAFYELKPIGEVWQLVFYDIDKNILDLKKEKGD